MLKDDPFSQGTPISEADILVDGNQKFTLKDFEFEFLEFAGHTPGCSVIKFDNIIFSGDFIFQGSIGRTDFPYSNSDDMKKSIQKILAFKENFKIFTGHGKSTTLDNERESLKNWYEYL